MRKRLNFSLILCFIVLIDISSGFVVKKTTEILTDAIRIQKISPRSWYTKSSESSESSKSSESSVPDHPPEIRTLKPEIEFILYSALVPNGTVIETPEQLNGYNFLEDSPIKFVIHGWRSSGYQEGCSSVKDGYLRYTNSNIFIVNWEKSASGWYTTTVHNLESVADTCADFLSKIIQMKRINAKLVHLIGHSLGAHISGIVGKRLAAENITIGRITGLDPAKICIKPDVRLSKSNADFVDVIHTSGGFLGDYNSLGHADFYPNGGTSMPGCIAVWCSHSKSWAYFAESITPPFHGSIPFFAKKCESFESFEKNTCKDGLTIMGEHTSLKARGKFYLNTNKEFPFSMGLKGINSKISSLKFDLE